MFGFFRRKKKVPLQRFDLTYRIGYQFSSGKVQWTDKIKITVPATERKEAERKLKFFVRQKIFVKIS